MSAPLVLDDGWIRVEVTPGHFTYIDPMEIAAVEQVDYSDDDTAVRVVLRSGHKIVFDGQTPAFIDAVAQVFGYPGPGKEPSP